MFICLVEDIGPISTAIAYVMFPTYANYDLDIGTLEGSMREMRPDLENAFPSKYICSDCNWNFPLKRLSELADFFRQKTAILAFSAHSCASFPFIQTEASLQPEDYATELPRWPLPFFSHRTLFS